MEWFDESRVADPAYALDPAHCAHEPDALGVRCQHCGIPAVMVPPDELAEALMAEVAAAAIRASGQLGWIETCNACDAIGPVDASMGYCAECLTEVGASCVECGRKHGSDRPNIAHYFRPSPRHHWRTSSTTVNASPCAIPTLRRRPEGWYADVPYDWEAWTPPKSATTLPGITAEMEAYTK